MDTIPEYAIERSFAAPLDLVWRVWTDPDLLSRWYGPGVETVVHAFDLRPGGEWRNEMIWGGNSNYQKMVFQEVLPQNRMVWHHCSADADWNIAVNSMMPDWPRVLLTTVTFESNGDRTDVRLTQTPLDASEAEVECFAATMSNMDSGWGSGYAIIDEMLIELQALEAQA